MILTIEKEELERGINFVKKFVGSNDTNPVYHFIYIGAERDTVVLKGMNGCVLARISLLAFVKESSEVLVDPNILGQMVATFDDGGISIKGGDENNKDIILRQGKRWRKLKTASPEDFPLAPVVGNTVNIDIPFADLLGYLNLVAFARSRSEDKPILQGIYLSQNEIAATDSERIAYVDLDIPLGDTLVFPPETLNVVKAISKVLQGNTVNIRCGHGGWLAISSQNFDVWLARIAGQYPTTLGSLVERSFRRQDGTRVSFERDAIVPALSLACTISDVTGKSERGWHLEIKVSDDLRLVMETDIGEMDDPVEAEISGGPTLVWVDPNQLLQDIRSAPEDTIEMKIWDQKTPIFISSGNVWKLIQAPVVTRKQIKTENVSSE